MHLLRLVFIPVVLVVIFVRPGWDEQSYEDFFIEAGGFLFLLAGLIIRIWCTFYIGGRKSKELITTGPYSLCRNPLYMGTFVLTIGIGLSFANLLMCVLVPLIVVPVHLVVVRLEESRLEEAFGEQFRAYKQKTPRFWPRFSSYNSPDRLNIDVRAVWRVTANAVGVLLLPWIEDLLEILHHHGIIPTLWHFP